jgi:hypothetical protein
MKTVICGIPYEIVLREPKDRDDRNYGSCDSKLARIQMDKTMPQAVRDQTLIHEWLHAVTEIYGCALEEWPCGVLSAELYREGFRVTIEEDE